MTGGGGVCQMFILLNTKAQLSKIDKKGAGGVKKDQNSVHKVYEWPLKYGKWFVAVLIVSRLYKS